MWIRLFLRVTFPMVLLVLASMGASAQSADPAVQEPLMGSEASPQVPVMAETPPAQVPGTPAGFGGEDGIYRILVVGDSLAGGLGAGMSRMVQDDPRFEIVNRFNESSGLARPEFYDWAASIPKIMQSKPFDAAVVLIGVNDRQDFRDGTVRYPFKSPEWVTSYDGQTDKTLDALKSQGVKIYWISLPPMADPVFDADMQFVSDMQRKRVAAKGGQYINVRPFFLAPDGSYVDRGKDDTGADRKLRSRDGITFFKQGNNRFGQLVIGAIKALENVGEAEATPVIAALPDATPPLANPQMSTSPIFGQEGLDGNAITFDASSVDATPDAAPQVAAAKSGSAVEGSQAMKGSQSERLLTEGAAMAAPPGRFDDFSYTPPAGAAAQ